MPRPAASECPNCGKAIDKSQFGCSSCWFQLPAELRRRVSANFRKPFGERLRGLPELYAEAMTVWRGEATIVAPGGSD